ncbi:DUF6702 family protein [Roseivirga misakiensis]|uniref:Peptidase E n=1 Tax=Roseivirga misakiensis TaxID=1563681 RepID=A0A1E5T6G9_9BACT|nr:DUF6702 family protein [Roseivirga misakiensis]OEK06946.1 hypothetical protein BFP71_04630 [Roseivirga misakiensis]
MQLNLIYSVLFSAYLFWHPFHVSVTDIEHDVKSKSVQVSHRIFLDDLEVGLKKFHKIDRIDTYKPSDEQVLDSLIGNYIKTKVSFLINGSKKEITYLGSELEGDGRWCYYEILDVEKVDEVEVTNVALMEVFDDQQNIVHFKSKGKLKSYKLDKDTKFINFKFDE